MIRFVRQPRDATRACTNRCRRSERHGGGVEFADSRISSWRAGSEDEEAVRIVEGVDDAIDVPEVVRGDRFCVGAMHAIERPANGFDERQ